MQRNNLKVAKKLKVKGFRKCKLICMGEVKTWNTAMLEETGINVLPSRWQVREISAI